MADLKFNLYINGKWIKKTGVKYIESIDPFTGKSWAYFSQAEKKDVDQAVDAAHNAMFTGKWSKMTASQKGACLKRLGALIKENSRELAEIETRDTGKLIRETVKSVEYTSDFYEFYGGLADKVGGSTFPIDKSDITAFTKRVPIGVVAAIIPFNSPLMLTAVKLGPALAAGNSVVIKPSEHASIPLLKLADLFATAGFPPGVLNIITGQGHLTGHYLTQHPLVKRIAFTGGAESARKVVCNSSKNFAKTTLELGGKSPQIVFEDANIESAVNGVIGGIFGASGQSCVAGSRLFIHEEIYTEVIEKIKSKTENIKIGDPKDFASEMGPLTTKAQLDDFNFYLNDALDKGSELIYGKSCAEISCKGWFVTPTILDVSKSTPRVTDEEVFGPLLCVSSFKNDEDAIEKANSSKYGLAAGIWTTDLTRAHNMSSALKCGIIWINMYRAASPLTPFGGFGLSGNGRESGWDAIYDYTTTKTIWINTSKQPVSDPFIVN